MSVTDITRKITDEAKQAAVEKLKQAERQKEDILASLEVKKAELKKSEQALLERELNNSLEKVKALAIQEAKLRKTKVKRALLDQVFTEALDRLKTIDDKQFEDFLEKKIKELNPDKGSILLVPGKRQKVGQAVIKKHPDLQLKIDEDFGDGFKIESSNNDFDLSFERLLENVRQDTETEVANILFAQE